MYVTPYEIGGFRWMLAFEPYVNATNHTPLGKVASITAKTEKSRSLINRKTEKAAYNFVIIC